jgi:hypothetical protein
VSAYGLSARSWQRGGRHSDLPLASCAVRSCKWLHLRSLGGRLPTCPVEVRGGEVWVGVEFDRPGPAAYWRQRLHEGMTHNLGLVIAKALQGQLAAGLEPLDIVRQAAVFGARNREGWARE